MRLALDRAMTSARIDADGRAHFTATAISKADVNPYRGREIPGWKELGLDPNAVYQMFRPPDELARAARSFNGLPVLSDHVATNAVLHPKALTIGATGTDCVFDGTFLRGSVVVWKKDAISGIANGRQAALSAGYAWCPIMRPGTWRGKPYSGVMRNIVGNHAAVVDKGRVPDCSLAFDRATIRRRTEFVRIERACQF
jgi:uncharacterized protein